MANPGTDRSAEFIYGTHAVEEALSGVRRCYRLLIAQNLVEKSRIQKLSSQAADAGVLIEHVESQELDRLTERANHQGIVLDAEPYVYAKFDEILATGQPVLLLDHLTDPQNVATLIRTAAAAGIGGILLPDRRAASITPAVVNASAGLTERVRIAQIVNTTSAMTEAKSKGYWTVVLDQDEDAQSLFVADIPEPTMWVVGAEGSGVSPKIRNHADVVVYIPMPGHAESLNAAVSGSMAIYESVRMNAE